LPQISSNLQTVLPDGKDAYVANIFDSTVSVIDTTKNMAVATVVVGNGPAAVGIIPPPH
jgi:YVTN family beta-propeller protein